MNEPIMIGIFDAHPSEADKEQVLYLEPQTISSGSQLITIQVESLPRYVSIDPYSTRPDLIRSDNFYEIN
jgi:hypothetical protein